MAAAATMTLMQLSGKGRYDICIEQGKTINYESCKLQVRQGNFSTQTDANFTNVNIP